MRRKLLSYTLILSMILSAVPVKSSAYTAQDTKQDAAIVWLIDVSGSMSTIDPQKYWIDAVSAGVDLAPNNAQVAFIAFNDTIVAQTAFYDCSDASSREAIMTTVSDAHISGYTDSNIGLAASLDLLRSKPKMDRHLFFIADISESGYKTRRSKYDADADTLLELTKQFEESRIKVHLLFIDTPKENHQFIPLWEDIAIRTGGSLNYIDDPSNLPKSVETLYQSEFKYNSSVTTAINTLGKPQDILIKLPSFGLDRVRVYISSDTAIHGFQFHADYADLAFSETRSYAMFSLTGDIPRTVTLTLPENTRSDVRVYIFADGSLSLSGVANSTAELSRENDSDVYRQKTTVLLTSEVDIYGAYGVDFNTLISLLDRDGHAVVIDNLRYDNSTFTFDFYPQYYGVYSASLQLESQGIRLSAETSISIDEIDLPDILVNPVAEQDQLQNQTQEPDISLWIAIIVGAALLLIAIIMIISTNRRHRRRRVPELYEMQSSVHPIDQKKEVYKEAKCVFTGKLDIYGVLIEGGATEVPATSVRLDKFVDNENLTLYNVFDIAGIPYRYKEAERIHLIPGSDRSLIIKNRSNAVVYCGGQPWLKGQQTTLSYGQKATVIFKDEVNEYEIYYHNATDKVRSGDSLQIALSE